MMNRPDHARADEPSGSGRIRVPRFVRWLAMIVALGLFLGALLMVWQQRETVLEAVLAIDAPAPRLVAMLFAAIVGGLVLSGATFHLLLRRFGNVGWIEMQALIAATGLLNFLPLRPGVVGRVAYHRQVNRIPILHSSRTIVEAAIISLSVAVYLAASAGMTIWLGANLWVVGFAPVPVLLIGALIPTVRLWSVCAILRFCDVALWSVRYHAAFGLLGLGLPHESALAFASISVIATMVPLISNGLGLREWAVGLLAPLLTSYQLTLGLTAELINRAAELIVIVIVGLVSLTWLMPRWREAHKSHTNADGIPNSDRQSGRTNSETHLERE